MQEKAKFTTWERQLGLIVISAVQLSIGLTI